ncbi:unnamed protein product (macronuclear) [Paramecium tetraurelia]|uniref:C2HC/C3H-type domain-containing protein n=1 Tax=Paramecium tetraurelia TaxID=5888 RepID=A0BVD8_PARTE|nr:uncharacterized protein GSPATT00005751001 [Paramecium tetraurelia]CAK62505.1 unnamed protein product [Paramecium tetraurelia]|eukprot:XP_001429903.1 hypothetical protein (macronuclear) [Paramecium tetraurelia strain d4-2]
MKPSSNASQQANQWALKKKEQMEKAAQMRAERKLAATGEMALGNKPNYDYDKPPSQNSQKQYYQPDLGNNNVRQQQYGQQQFQMNDIGFQNVQPNRQSSLGKQQPQPSYDKYGYNQNNQFSNNKPPSQEGQRKVQQGVQAKPQMNQAQQSRQQYGKIEDDYDYQNRQYGQPKQQQQQQQYNAKQPPPVQKQQQYRPPSGTYDQSNGYNKPSNQSIKPPVQSNKQPANNKQQSNLRTNQQPTYQPQQQYYNPIDDIPIKKSDNIPNINIQNPEPLYECSKGCGRSFAKLALQKHEKICVKVFQKQRKQFDAQKHRIISNEQISHIKNQDKIEQKYEKALAKKQNWKNQSEAFRAAIIAAKGGKLTKDQKNAMQEASKSNLVQCNYCGRSFNQQAAERHIPFCAQKSKIPPKQPQKRR